MNAIPSQSQEPTDCSHSPPQGALSVVGPASQVSGRGIVCGPSCGVFSSLCTYYGGNPMAVTELCTPSQADDSGSIPVALYNIRSGWNGGLESALRGMNGMDVNHLMHATSVCKMGSPNAIFLAIPACMRTGIPICVRQSPYGKLCIWGSNL